MPPPPKMKAGLRNWEMVWERLWARTPNFQLETFWRKKNFDPHPCRGPGTDFSKKCLKSGGGILAPPTPKIPVMVPVMVKNVLYRYKMM